MESNSCPGMEFFMNESNSDIHIYVEGHKIPAHKLVLSLKSPVFKSMLFGDFKESHENEIIISDASLESFKIMLKFIYCQTLQLNEENDYKRAMDVFRLGHKYQLVPLMAIIEQKLTQMLTIENIEVIHNFGSFYELNALLKSIEDFIENNSSLLIEKDLNPMFENKLLRFMANKYKESLKTINKLRGLEGKLKKAIQSKVELETEYEELYEDYKKIKRFFQPLTKGKKVFFVRGKCYEKVREGEIDGRYGRICFPPSSDVEFRY